MQVEVGAGRGAAPAPLAPSDLRTAPASGKVPRAGEHDHQILGELDARSDQRPVRRENEGIAVEDQLVLAPHLVDVDDGAPRLGDAAGQHGQLPSFLAESKRAHRHAGKRLRRAQRLA